MAKSFTFRLPPDLRRHLDELCRQQDRTASDVVRAAIHRHFAIEELRQLRERLRPHAAARGFVADDDIFDSVS